jgi:hypothetical protein
MSVELTVVLPSRSPLSRSRQLFTLALGVALLASYMDRESNPKGEPPNVADNTGSQGSGSPEAGSTNISFDLLERLADCECKGGCVWIGVEVVFDGELEVILKAGFALDSYIPGYATGDLSVSRIRALAERYEVRSIRLPGRMRPARSRT